MNDPVCEAKTYPKTRYITLGKLRLVFRDGKYHGWYHWK